MTDTELLQRYISDSSHEAFNQLAPPPPRLHLRLSTSPDSFNSPRLRSCPSCPYRSRPLREKTAFRHAPPILALSRHSPDYDRRHPARVPTADPRTNLRRARRCERPTHRTIPCLRLRSRSRRRPQRPERIRQARGTAAFLRKPIPQSHRATFPLIGRLRSKNASRAPSTNSARNSPAAASPPPPRFSPRNCPSTPQLQLRPSSPLPSPRQLSLRQRPPYQPPPGFFMRSS